MSSVRTMIRPSVGLNISGMAFEILEQGTNHSPPVKGFDTSPSVRASFCVCSSDFKTKPQGSHLICR